MRKASAIYAEAFGRDPQFAQFYRSLEAYRASFRKQARRDGARPGHRVLPRHARRRGAAGAGAASSAAWPRMGDLLLGALALMLVLEGLLPFFSPAAGAASSSARCS